MLTKWYEDEDYLELVEDLLSNEAVLKLEGIKHHYITNRLEHSLGVSYRSFKLAKRFNLDCSAVARAGLLHDLFFYESCDKNAVGGKGHNYEHPRIALKNALEITDLNEKEKDIILKHMFGATFDVPKYAESWIVTLMDKQSSLIELRELVLQSVVNRLRFIIPVM